MSFAAVTQATDVMANRPTYATVERQVATVTTHNVTNYVQQTNTRLDPTTTYNRVADTGLVTYGSFAGNSLSGSQVVIGAQGDVALGGNVAATAGSLGVTAGGALSVAGVTVNGAVEAAVSSLNATTGLTLAASGALTLDAASSLRVSGAAANIALSANHDITLKGNVRTLTSGDVTILAGQDGTGGISGNVAANITTGDLTVSAGTTTGSILLEGSAVDAAGVLALSAASGGISTVGNAITAGSLSSTSATGFSGIINTAAAALAVTGYGNIVLTGVGALDVTNATAAHGNVTLANQTAGTALSVGTISGTTVNLTSVSGLNHDTSSLVQANSLVALAAGAIDLLTSVGTLDAIATAGAITIGNSGGAALTLTRVAALGGDISITSANSIAVASIVANTTDGVDVAITSTAGAITKTGVLSTTVTGGSVTLTAATGIAGLTLSTGEVSASTTSGNVSLVAAPTASNAGSLTVTEATSGAGNVTITTSSGMAVTHARAGGSTGVLTLQADGNLYVKSGANTGVWGDAELSLRSTNASLLISGSADAGSKVSFRSANEFIVPTSSAYTAANMVVQTDANLVINYSIIMGGTSFTAISGGNVYTTAPIKTAAGAAVASLSTSTAGDKLQTVQTVDATTGDVQYRGASGATYLKDSSGNFYTVRSGSLWRHSATVYNGSGGSSAGSYLTNSSLSTSSSDGATIYDTNGNQITDATTLSRIVIGGLQHLNVTTPDALNSTAITTSSYTSTVMLSLGNIIPTSLSISALGATGTASVTATGNITINSINATGAVTISTSGSVSSAANAAGGTFDSLTVSAGSSINLKGRTNSLKMTLASAGSATFLDTTTSTSDSLTLNASLVSGTLNVETVGTLHVESATASSDVAGNSATLRGSQALYIDLVTFGYNNGTVIAKSAGYVLEATPADSAIDVEANVFTLYSKNSDGTATNLDLHVQSSTNQNASQDAVASVGAGGTYSGTYTGFISLTGSGDLTINSGLSGGSNIVISTSGVLYVNAVISAQDSVNIRAASIVFGTGGSLNSNGHDVLITSTSGNVSMAAGDSITASGASITIDASGTATVASLTATEVSITADSGNIEQRSGATIYADHVSLEAGSTDGSGTIGAGGAIRIDTAVIDSVVSHGGTTLSLLGVSEAGTINTNGGTLTLTANNTLTISGSFIVGAGDISSSGGIVTMLTDASIVSSGYVTLSASTSLLLSDVSGSVVSLTATSGSINEQAGKKVSATTSMSLSSGSSIGTLNKPFLIDTPTLTSANITGTLVLEAAHALTINDASAATITVIAADTLTIGGVRASNALTVTAADDLTLTGAGTASSIILTSDGGDFVMGSAASLNAGSGSGAVTIDAAGSASLRSVSGGTVSVTAETGAITRVGSATSVTATTAILDAATNIGSSGTALKVTVTTLQSVDAAGDAYIALGGATSVGRITNTGIVNVTAGGTVTMTGALTGGAITLDVSSGNLTMGSASTLAGTGDVSVTAANNVSLSSLRGDDVLVQATGGNLLAVGSGTNVTGTSFSASVAGKVGSSSSAPIILAVGSIGSVGGVTAGSATGGEVNLKTTSTVTIGTITSGAGVSLLGAGAVSLTGGIAASGVTIQTTGQDSAGRFSMSSGVLIDAGSGLASITTGGDAALAKVKSTGSVAIDAGGNLTAVGSSSKITANSLSITADGAIGVSGTRVVVATPTVTNLQSGYGIYLSEVGSTISQTTLSTVTAGNKVDVLADNDLVLSGTINTAGGAAFSADSITFTKATTTGSLTENANSTVSLVATSGDVSMASGTSISAGTGDVTATAAGNVTLAVVSGDAVGITSTGGSITAVQSAAAIIANQVTLSSSSTIGTSNAVPLVMTTGSIAGITAAGDAWIKTTGSTSVGAISDTAGTLKLTATGSLDMTADSTVANATIVTTGGALRMGEGVTLDAGNGAITFTSSTSIVLGDIQGGVVSLTASSGGIQGDPTVSVPDVLATTSLSISATDDVGSASAMLRVKTPLITSATGTGGTYLAVTDAMSITSVTRSGALVITDTGALTFTGTSTAASANLSTTSGDLTVASTATLGASSGNVSLTAAGNLALHGVTGGVVIARAQGGAITTLGSGPSITAATSLALDASGAIGSSGTNFSVSTPTIIHAVAAGGGLWLSDSVAASIGTVTAGGLVKLSAAGQMDLTSAVSSGAASDVTLTTTSAGKIVMAAGSSVSSGRDVVINAAGNLSVTSIAGRDISLSVVGKVLAVTTDGSANFTGATLHGSVRTSFGDGSTASITVDVGDITTLSTRDGGISITGKSVLNVGVLLAPTAVWLKSNNALTLGTAIDAADVTLITTGSDAQGRFSMAAGSFIGNGSGDVSITTTENAFLEGVTGAIVTLKAGGNITRSSASELITGNTSIGIEAGGAVGASGAPLKLATPAISSLVAGGLVNIGIDGATRLGNITTNDAFTLNTTGALTVGGNINTGAGQTISATSITFSNGSMIDSNASTIALTARTGGITMGFMGTPIASTGGVVTMNATGTIELGLVVASDVTIISSGAGITNVMGYTTPSVRADRVTLSAGTTIGEAATPLLLTTPNVVSVTASGRARIQNTVDASYGSITNLAGDLNLTSEGNLTMTAGVTVSSATVTTLGGDLMMSPGVTLNANSGVGSVTFDSQGAISLGTIKGGVVQLTARAGGIQGDATAVLSDVWATTKLSMTASGNIGAVATPLRIKTPLIEAVSASTGSVWLGVTDEMSVTTTNVGSALVINSTGKLSFTGTNSAATATIANTQGDILVTSTATLSTGSGNLTISAAGAASLHGVTGGTVSVTANAGDISTLGSGRSVTATLLTLDATGNIGGSAAFDVKAATISHAIATGSIRLAVTDASTIVTVTAGGLVNISDTAKLTTTGAITTGSASTLTVTTTNGANLEMGLSSTMTAGSTATISSAGNFLVNTLTGTELALTVGGAMTSVATDGRTNLTGTTLGGTVAGNIGAGTSAPIYVDLGNISNLQSTSGTVSLLSKSALTIGTLQAAQALSLVARNTVTLNTKIAGVGVSLTTSGAGALGRFTMATSATLDAKTGTAAITTSEKALLEIVKGNVITIGASGDVSRVSGAGMLTGTTSLSIQSGGDIGASAKTVWATVPLITSLNATGSIYMDLTGATSLTTMTAGSVARLIDSAALTVTGNVQAATVQLTTSSGALRLADGSTVRGTTKVEITGYGDVGLSAVTGGNVDITSQHGNVTDTTAAETANVTTAGTLRLNASGNMGAAAAGDLEFDVAKWADSTITGGAFFQTLSSIDLSNLVVNGAVTGVTSGSVRMSGDVTVGSITLSIYSNLYNVGDFVMAAGTKLASTGTTNIGNTGAMILARIEASDIILAAGGAISDVTAGDTANLVATNVTLDAKGSIGVSADSSGLVMTTGHLVRANATGFINLTVTGGLTVDAAAASSALSITSGGAMTLGGTARGVGAALRTRAGVLTMTSGSLLDAGIGLAAATAYGDLKVSRINGGQAALTSNTGAIIDNQTGDLRNVTASSVSLAAATHIGVSATTRLLLQSASLTSVVATAGTLYLDILGNAAIGTMSANGRVDLVDAGGLTLSGAMSGSAVGITVNSGALTMGTGATIDAKSQAADLLASGSITLGRITAGATTLRSTSGSILDGTADELANVTATTLSMSTAAGAIGAAGTGEINVSLSGTLSGTASSGSWTGGVGALSVGAYSTTAGALTLTATGALSLGGTITASAVTLGATGDLTMSSLAVVRTAGALSITSGRTMSLTAVTGAATVIFAGTALVDASSDELANITATTLALTAGTTLGAAGTGDIDISASGAFSASAGSHAWLEAKGALNVSAISTAGALDLTTAANLVQTGVIQANGMKFTVNGTGTLAMGNYATMISTGAVELIVAGSMSLNQITGTTVALTSNTGSILNSNPSARFNINASTLALTAKAGNLGASNVGTLNTVVTGAITGETRGLWLKNTGVTTMGSMKATGVMNVSSTAGLVLNGTLTLSGASILNADGVITMADAAQIQAGANALSLIGAGTITLSTVVGGAVTINSATGSVVDGTTAELANISASTLSLTVAGDIGASGAGDLNTSVTGSITGSARAVTLRNSGATTMGNMTASGVMNLTSTAGLSLNGTLTLSGGGMITAASGALTMAAAAQILGGANTVSLSASGNVTLASVVGGAVSITSTAGSILDATTSAELANVTASTLSLTAATDIGASGTGDLNTAVSGAITGSARVITLKNAGATSVGDMTARGVMNLTSTAGLSLNGTLTLNAGGTLNASGVITMANAAQIQAGATALTLSGTGNITLGKIAGGAVSITSTGGSILDGTTDELANVTASALTLTTAGDTGTFGTGGDLNTAVSGAITGNMRGLSLKNVGTTTLGNVTTTGAMTVTSTGALQLNGTLTASGKVTLAAAGYISMTTAARIAAGSYAVDLAATGDITLGRVSGGAVSIVTSAGSILDGTTDELANVTASSLLLNATGSLGTGLNDLNVTVSGALTKFSGTGQVSRVTKL